MSATLCQVIQVKSQVIHVIPGYGRHITPGSAGFPARGPRPVRVIGKE